MNHTNVDKNLSVIGNLSRSDAAVYDCLSDKIALYGLIPPKNENDIFRRIPADVAGTVNWGVSWLHANTAGGRIRFKTDSSYVAVAVTLGETGKMSHFALTGSVGLDLYSRVSGGEWKHAATFAPKFDIEHDLVGEVYLPTSEMREFELNFPLYSEVASLSVCLDPSAELLPASEYGTKLPVAFYGSSVTQGACASRPGLTYQSMLSRELDFNYINLGFSGNAMGELAMAEYIASLDLSVYVSDYDYNAPTAEHLAATYEPFMMTIRNKHPELPIVCLTSPGPFEAEERKAIIRDFCEKRRAEGDMNIHFVDIGAYIRENGLADLYSTDLLHPNDLGFYAMANAVKPVLKEILK